MLAIRLPQDIEKRLNDLAKATGLTKTFYAREAIPEHTKDWKIFTWLKKSKIE